LEPETGGLWLKVIRSKNVSKTLSQKPRWECWSTTTIPETKEMEIGFWRSRHKLKFLPET
jgi:hypothetical protein